MDSYSGFAYVYDTFMDETPYEEWKDYIVEILKDNGIDDGLVLDLGCGTGTLTRLLSDSGYDMIGVDNSEDMLCVAREYEMDEDGSLEGSNILYLCQDMRQFELYGTVRAVISALPHQGNGNAAEEGHQADLCACGKPEFRQDDAV